MFRPVPIARRRPLLVAFATLLLGPSLGVLLAGRGRWVVPYLLLTLATIALLYAAAVAGILPSMGHETLYWSAVIAFNIIGAVHVWLALRRDSRAELPRYAGVVPAFLIATLLVPMMAGLAAFGVRGFVVQPFQSASASMLPTLQVGDTYFVAKFAYGYGQFSLPFGLPAPALPIGHAPERGDIVVFRHPDGRSDWVKRLIGLPGETVEMVDGEVRINGRALPQRASGVAEIVMDDVPMTVSAFEERLSDGRSYTTYRIEHDPAGGTMPAKTLPDDAYFVLGDFRSNSVDSRHAQLGLVPRDRLIGRVDYVYWDGARDAAVFRPVD